MTATYEWPSAFSGVGFSPVLGAVSARCPKHASGWGQAAPFTAAQSAFLPRSRMLVSNNRLRQASLLAIRREGTGKGK
jgi:hypothetical protein